MLFKLGNDEDPNNDNAGKELVITSLNSVRGVAAKSAIKLFKNLIEKDIEPPSYYFIF